MSACNVSTPPLTSSNAHYVSNRDPLVPNPLVKLPPGAVQPEGWLRHQLDLMANGMTGRLTEVSDFLKPENGWFGGPKEGWEEQPYWLRGFQSLAILTGDERLRREAGRWIEAVLGSQQADGYFGAQAHKSVVGKNGQSVCDLWPHMVMLDTLIAHAEHTGDARVVPFMRRFFEFCRRLPEESFIPPETPALGDWKPFVQYWRAGDMIPHLHWLYNRTGEDWLLPLAARFHHHIQPPVATNYRPDKPYASEWLDGHVVNFTQRFSYPGLFYAQTREAWRLAQSEYWYRQHMDTWGQQPRGIFGADENIRPGCVDPRQAIETCGMTEFAKSFYLLARITGEPLYADRVEDIFFNHFPAASTPDLKALHYLTSSNQPQLDDSLEHDYYNKGRMIIYSPHLYRCCQHNVAMGWPWFAENLWQASSDNGLVAFLYAGGVVTAKVGAGQEVTVREETDYPFTGRVTLTLECREPATFPLYLRVPRWCSGFTAKVRGGATETFSGRQGQYLRIERTWSNRDLIEIDMPMELGVTRWPRTGAATVDRGPLSYSVRIGERWRRCGGIDEWPEWEVLPTTPWNYGLVLDPQSPVAGFKVIARGVREKQPWTPEAAPVEIKVRARRIPGWKLVKETADVLRPGPIRSTEPEEEITLVPLGCARLRMACLPVIGVGPEAADWA